MSPPDPWQALVDAFILPERRARLRALLASAKGRAKLRAWLAHFHDLDPRYAHPLPDDVHTPAEIASLLRSHGAPPMCYVLSEESGIDGRELPLEQALDRVVGLGMGTFFSCVPGRLAYFEGEEPRERYILERAG